MSSDAKYLFILGKGIVNVEDKDGWHGKPVPADTINPIAATIHNKGASKLKPEAPIIDAPNIDLNLGHITLSTPPSYKIGEKVATRAAYGTALVKLGENSERVIALDGDTKNSTFSEKFLKQFPDRFIECFIAEQNMVGVAIGASTRNRTIPFCRFECNLCSIISYISALLPHSSRVQPISCVWAPYRLQTSNVLDHMLAFR
jgi:transketolase